MTLGRSKVIREGKKLMDIIHPGGANGNAPRLSVACFSFLLVGWSGICA